METAKELFWIPRDDTRYVYSVAVVRALEHTLLRRKTLEAMARAESAQEALQELGETSYARFMSSGMTEASCELILRDVLLDTYSVMQRLMLDRELERAILSIHDYHNLKAVIESRLDEKESPVGTVPYGLIPVQDIALAVDSGVWHDIPEYLGHAYRAASKAYERNKDPRVFEMIIDLHALEHRVDPLLKAGDRSVRIYAEAFADVTNIKLLIRLNRLSPDLTTLEWAFCNRGSLPFGLFSSLLGKGSPAFIEHFSSTAYAKALREGLTYLEEKESYSVLDRELENILIGYLQQTKFTVFGPAPLISYVFAREHEVRMVRLVMSAKINRIPTERIVARLSMLYV